MCVIPLGLVNDMAVTLEQQKACTIITTAYSPYHLHIGIDEDKSYPRSLTWRFSFRLHV